LICLGVRQGKTWPKTDFLTGYPDTVFTLLISIRSSKIIAPPDQTEPNTEADETPSLAQPCPCCGGSMVVIDTFESEPVNLSPGLWWWWRMAFGYDMW
jgi:hypothetical protein